MGSRRKYCLTTFLNESEIWQAKRCPEASETSLHFCPKMESMNKHHGDAVQAMEHLCSQFTHSALQVKLTDSKKSQRACINWMQSEVGDITMEGSKIFSSIAEIVDRSH